MERVWRLTRGSADALMLDFFPKEIAYVTVRFLF